jgi:hypothetical protein
VAAARDFVYAWLGDPHGHPQVPEILLQPLQ